MRVVMVLLFSVLAPLAFAAGLTGKDVERWVESMPAVQGWLDQHEDQLPEDEDMSDDKFDMDAMMKRGIQQLKDAGLYSEFNSRVKAAGFRNAEHWAETSQRVSMAYFALSMEGQNDPREEIEAQLQQIRSMDVPAEQKAMMEGMLQSSLSMLKAMENVSAADKAVVRPYLPQITEQFESSME